MLGTECSVKQVGRIWLLTCNLHTVYGMCVFDRKLSMCWWVIGCFLYSGLWVSNERLRVASARGDFKEW